MSEQRLGMLIDLSLCVGCNACVVACKQENDVPLGKFNTWVESFDVECEDGRVRRANVSKLCNHCANPACVEACPTGASYVAEDGTVQIDREKCIGCDACIAACPYGARWHDDEANVVGKCSFCHHRSSNGLLPACVATCVTEARIFGDLNDPDSDISQRIAAAGDAVSVLLPDSGADPQVYYIGLDAIEAMPKRSAVHKGGNVIESYDGFASKTTTPVDSSATA